ncbi:MAG: hypothetical protein IID32_01215, partial [Planctomycetes bacterium]|nr:hypothetical protein [Planctomycetota bacterium]
MSLPPTTPMEPVNVVAFNSAGTLMVTGHGNRGTGESSLDNYARIWDAARTELLQKIGTRHHTDPYLLCSNQHCQVYSGAGREHPRTTRAVKRTRGIVFLRASGGLVD